MAKMTFDKILRKVAKEGDKHPFGGWGVLHDIPDSDEKEIAKMLLQAAAKLKAKRKI